MKFTLGDVEMYHLASMRAQHDFGEIYVTSGHSSAIQRL